MVYINILLILFIAMLVSFIIGKDMEDVLPPCLFVFLLMLYGVAILGKAHHSYMAFILVFGAIWIYYVAKNKRLLPTLSDIKAKIIKPGFLLYVGVVILMFIAYSNHFVTVWDDFHYNATFPKDMYFYGTMPTGFKSATFYRSYLPLMQLFFYWGFQGIKGFSEPLMFQYKMFLIYTCMFPLFKEVNGGKTVKRVAAGIVASLLPFLFMYELMESLSMDTFMAVIFGYALVVILYEKRDWFSYVKIASALVALSLVKQIAPIFVVISLATWLAKDLVLYLKETKSSDKTLANGNVKFYRVEAIAFAISSFFSLVAVMSWKVFCNIKGNTVYLSNKLSESVSDGLFKLPDYGVATIKNFIASTLIQKMSLDFDGLSLDLTLLIAISLVVMIIKLNKGNSGIYAGFVVILLGLFGYLLVLLYTYLFVFEPWEADSLSSIDRYFGTYALVLIYVPVMGLMQSSTSKVLNIKYVRNERIVYIITVVITIITFPITNFMTNLVPPIYKMAKSSELEVVNEAKAEVERINVKDRETRTVLMVTNEENTLYSRDIIYELIPLVPTQILVTDEMDDMSQAILDKCEDEHVYYVYFTDRFDDDEMSVNKISHAMYNDEIPTKGHLYYYDEAARIIRNLE